MKAAYEMLVKAVERAINEADPIGLLDLGGRPWASRSPRRKRFLLIASTQLLAEPGEPPFAEQDYRPARAA